MINYNTAHSKVAHQYLLKAFYNKTNKKEYNSQIQQYNVCHTNIIAMKDVIILEKAREKKMLLESIANTTAPAKVAQLLSLIDLARRYNWAMSDAELDAAKKQGLNGIKKYSRCAGQVEMELDWLHNWFLALAIFVRHSHRLYNNKKISQNISVWQNIDPK